MTCWYYSMICLIKNLNFESSFCKCRVTEIDEPMLILTTFRTDALIGNKWLLAFESNQIAVCQLQSFIEALAFKRPQPSSDNPWLLRMARERLWGKVTKYQPAAPSYFQTFPLKLYFFCLDLVFMPIV